MILAVFLAFVVAFVVVAVLGSLIWWVVSTAIVGAIFGGLARLAIPGRQNIGLLATVVCGWVGAIVGGAVGGIVWGRHHHHILTLLIEIGVSAVAVIGWSGTHRNSVTGSSSHRIIDI
jgi:uncharacterized membrane protein YeaQ/YmgE (transglycosylase-associated protein family)